LPDADLQQRAIALAETLAAGHSDSQSPRLSIVTSADQPTRRVRQLHPCQGECGVELGRLVEPLDCFLEPALPEGRLAGQVSADGGERRAGEAAEPLGWVIG
jgi:hypothetical protein